MILGNPFALSKIGKKTWFCQQPGGWLTLWKREKNVSGFL